MKLCVTSTGDNINSKADGSFGRADYFLVIDTETLEYEAVVNGSADVSQGAGIAAAQTISNKGVDALLTGYLGPKAFAALESSGIRIYEGIGVDETVREAVLKFKKGLYREKTDTGRDALRGPGNGGGRRPGGQGKERGRSRRGALS